MVLFPAPLDERRTAVLAMALTVHLVRDVPRVERGAVAVSLGELAVDDSDLLSVDGRGVAMVVAFAEELLDSSLIRAENLGVLFSEPLGAGSRRGSEDDLASLCLDIVKRAIHKGRQRAACACVMHGREKYVTVEFWSYVGKLPCLIVVNTTSAFLTTAAS